MMMLLLSLVLPSLMRIPSILSANALKGLTVCMNNQDCLGVHRECSHQDHELVGRCVCQDGYEQVSVDSIACDKKAVQKVRGLHVSCNTDDDCKRSEVCMSWRYDPALEFARKLRSRIATEHDTPEKHQFCIDAWIIYKNHLESLDEPRTGGGLRSRNFEADDYFFSGRRPPRVQQQYIGFAEDMMLILFLVCILATLVTVHRAACYRSIQDARRNSPLRHLLPIAEDRPPPYMTSMSDSADGLTSLMNSAAVPKPASETPPPSYEEALYRQSVRLPGEGPLTEETQPPGASPVVTSEVRVEETRSQSESSIPPPDQLEASIPAPDQSEASVPVLETVPATVSVENETESGATGDSDRVNNSHNDDEMEENNGEAVIEGPHLQEPASLENQVETDTRSQAQSHEGLESQEEPSSAVTIGEEQTIPVPVVKANQEVVDGKEAIEASIKGTLISKSQPDICDTDNNVLI